MYLFLIIIYCIICIFLICTILLQAGRGGGLTDAFGGAAGDLFGTRTPDMLKKATAIGAILFLVLSLVLAMITARRGKSLFEQMRLPAIPLAPIEAPEKIIKEVTTEEVTKKVTPEENTPTEVPVQEEPKS